MESENFGNQGSKRPMTAEIAREDNFIGGRSVFLWELYDEYGLMIASGWGDTEAEARRRILLSRWKQRMSNDERLHVDIKVVEKLQ